MPTKIEKDEFSGQDTTGHEWDGIKELNTPLPRWWLYTFYVTVALSLVWCVLYPSVPGWNSYFGGTLGYSQRDDVAEKLAAAAKAQSANRDRIKAMSIAEVKADPELNRFAQAGARVLFSENCAGCHQAGGAGVKGYPNLIDDDWLWGGSLSDIEKTLRHGIRAASEETRLSQMPRFLADGLLKPAEIEAVAAHVLSLSGKGPVNQAGAKIFAEQCAVCHAENGGGNRELGAPNLRDQIWLYGGDKASIIQSIANSRAGVMPAWTGRLDEAAIKMLTLYVHAFGGGE